MTRQLFRFLAGPIGRMTPSAQGLAIALMHCALLAIGVEAAAAESELQVRLGPPGAVGAIEPLSADQLRALDSGTAIDVIVEYEASAVHAEVQRRRAALRLPRGEASLLNLRATRLARIKDAGRARVPVGQTQVLQDYAQLPVQHLRLRSRDALRRLQSAPEVKAVWPESTVHTMLDPASGTLINLAAVQALPVDGSGTTVAVIDTGVDYTKSDFGCTAPGVPSGCKVNAYQSFVSGSTALDADGHGSNVAGIVVAVAPGARIAALNVFGSSASASSTDILSALNWVLNHQASLNIVSVNMSLGDSSQAAKGCGSVYAGTIQTLVSAGIAVNAASGNNGYKSGISAPACDAGVTAVGAVYPGNVGGWKYSAVPCTDSSTTADQITCFTNLAREANGMVLAPGFAVTAAGISDTGTSQATPFIAAWAALNDSIYGISLPPAVSGRFPSTAPNSLLRYSGFAPGINGPSLQARRNGVAVGQFYRRLDLLQSLRPGNDDVAGAYAAGNVFSEEFGGITGTNAAAGSEANEPLHAAQTGGHSVWFRWTAPYSGAMSLDTHGSAFDTLLAVYTGTSVASLTAVASNDDDGSPGGTSGLSFQASAGTSYLIAVDGRNGASGLFGLFISPANSSFDKRQVIAGTSGSDPNQTNQLGASSGVNTYNYWKWTASATGNASFDTHGSGFDTVLFVYDGDSLSTLLGSNDDDGSAGGASGLTVPVVAGHSYVLQVRNKVAGSYGSINLDWALAASVLADLQIGSTRGGVTVRNNGPADAAQVVVTFNLSAAATLQAASSGCTPTSSTRVTCTIGTLASGAQATVLVSFTGSADITATATVSSSTQDPQSANDSVALAGLVSAQDQGDVPTLPEWAAMLMAASLLGGIWRAGAKGR